MRARVTGLESLKRRLSAFADGLRRDLIDQMNDTADAIRDEARDTVTRDTGALRTTIKSEHADPSDKRAAALVTAGGPTERDRWVSSRTGRGVRRSVVDYAPHVEFGTSQMEAQPFMRPAAEKHRNRHKKAMRDIVKQHVRRASAGE